MNIEGSAEIDYEKQYRDLVDACLAAGPDADFDLWVTGKIMNLIALQNNKGWTALCEDLWDRLNQEVTAEVEADKKVKRFSEFNRYRGV